MCFSRHGSGVEDVDITAGSSTRHECSSNPDEAFMYEPRSNEYSKQLGVLRALAEANPPSPYPRARRFTEPPPVATSRTTPTTDGAGAARVGGTGGDTRTSTSTSTGTTSARGGGQGKPDCGTSDTISENYLACCLRTCRKKLFACVVGDPEACPSVGDGDLGLSPIQCLNAYKCCIETECPFLDCRPSDCDCVPPDIGEVCNDDDVDCCGVNPFCCPNDGLCALDLNDCCEDPVNCDGNDDACCGTNNVCCGDGKCAGGIEDCCVPDTKACEESGDCCVSGSLCCLETCVRCLLHD